MSNFMFQDISNFVIFKAMFRNAQPVCKATHQETKSRMAVHLRNTTLTSNPNKHPPSPSAAPMHTMQGKVSSSWSLTGDLSPTELYARVRDHARRARHVASTPAYSFRTKNTNNLVEQPKTSIRTFHKRVSVFDQTPKQ